MRRIKIGSSRLACSGQGGQKPSKLVSWLIGKSARKVLRETTAACKSKIVRRSFWLTHDLTALNCARNPRQLTPKT